MEQFIAQAFVYKFIERLAENIGIPNLFRVFLKLFEQVFDKLFGLALAADNGRDLGLNIGFEHMNRRCGRGKLHAVTTALFDDFRLVERQFVNGRHHNAVAGRLDLVERRFQLIVLAADFRKLAHAGNKPLLAVDFKPCFFRKHLIEQVAVHRDGNPRRALPELHAGDARVSDVFTVFEFFGQNGDIAHQIHFLRRGVDRRISRAAQPVVRRKRHQPRREIDRDFANREFKQHLR